MKRSNLKKILMMLALVIIVQNGAVIVSSSNGNTGSYSEDNAAAPYSDVPDFDEDYD